MFNATPLRLLRGHPSTDPKSLLVRKGRSLLGGGLCLTAETHVGVDGMNCRRGGLHVVELQGPLDRVIDLDRSFLAQPKTIQEAVVVARRWMSINDPVPIAQSTWHALIPEAGYPRPSTGAEMHACLAHLGIWMLWSRSRGLGEPGALDEQHNYCLVSQSHIRVIATFNRTSRNLTDRVQELLVPANLAQRAA